MTRESVTFELNPAESTTLSKIISEIDARSITIRQLNETLAEQHRTVKMLQDLVVTLCGDHIPPGSRIHAVDFELNENGSSSIEVNLDRTESEQPAL